MFKKVGIFEGVNIYESSLFKNGHGLTIPQLGIITYANAFSKSLDLGLIKHEFGHILQWRKMGTFKFYAKIGLPSLTSAIRASFKKNHIHRNHPVEINANQLAYHHFQQPNNWDLKRFPI